MKCQLLIFITFCLTMCCVGIKFSELKPVSSVLNNYYNGSNQDVAVLLTYEYFLHGHDLHGFCFSAINHTKLLEFSMSLCQTFGFHSLEKFYPVNYTILNGILTGSFSNISCPDDAFSVKDCEWEVTDNISCHDYLGVECSYCKESVNISADEQYIIEIPSYFECRNLSYCLWNITLNKPASSVTVIEINKNYSIRSRPVNETAAYFEITWFDRKTNLWHIKKYSALYFSGDIIVPSDMLVVKFAVQNSCHLFDGSRVLVWSQNVSQENRIHSVGQIYYAFIVLVFVACIVLVSFTCICCSVWKRKSGFRSLFGRSYALSNRSEFDFLYARQMNPTFSKDTEGLVVKFSPREPHPEAQLCTSESGSLIPETRGVEVIMKDDSSIEAESSSHMCNSNEISESDTTTICPEVIENDSFLQLFKKKFLSCFSFKNSLTLPSILKPSEGVLENELEEGSLEGLLNKFDSLVLSFHWSDMTTDDTSVSEDGDDKQDYSTSLQGLKKKYSDKSYPPSGKGYLHRMVSLSDEDSRSSVWESVISDQDTRFCVSSNSESSFCSFQHLDSMSYTCSEPDIFQSLEFIHKP